MITTADVMELARLADGLIGYAATDGFEAQMRDALEGEFPDGAEPVEVCIDDIDCMLSTLGYNLHRQRDPNTHLLRYAVDVDGIAPAPGIVSTGG